MTDSDDAPAGAKPAPSRSRDADADVDVDRVEGSGDGNANTDRLAAAELGEAQASKRARQDALSALNADINSFAKNISALTMRALDEPGESKEAIERAITEIKAQQAKLEAQRDDLRRELGLPPLSVPATAPGPVALPPLPPKPNLLADVAGSGEFAFIKTDAYTEAMGRLEKSLNMYPTDELAEITQPVIIGPMGVGKTRTGKEIAVRIAREADIVSASSTKSTKPGPSVALYVNVIKLVKKLPRVPGDLDALLAAALFHAIFPEEVIPETLSKRKMTEHIKLGWGVNSVVLHLDEIGREAELVRRILQASAFTLDTKLASFLVLTIATGVQPAADWLFKEKLFYDTGTKPKQIILSHFPLRDPNDASSSPLESAFATAIGFASWDEYAQCDNLRFLFRDCGGHPRLVQDLAKIVNAPEWARLRDPGRDFPTTTAKVLFAKLVDEASSQYSKDRWHDLVRKNVPRTHSRDSWEDSSKPLIRRALLCCFTDRAVAPDAQVLENTSIPEDIRSTATYNSCAMSGLVRLGRQGDLGPWRLGSPLVALIATDRLCGLLPILDAESANPFDQSPFTHESLGATTLYLRLCAAREFLDARTPLASLRPGALSVNAQVLDISTPGASLVFHRATVHMRLLVASEFQTWRVVVTAEDEPEVDAFAVLEGKVNDVTVVVVWLLQAKKRRFLEPSSGEESEATLGPSGVVRLVGGMRTVAASVRAKLEAAHHAAQLAEEKPVPASAPTGGGGWCTKPDKDAVLPPAPPLNVRVVYDVFTDRLPTSTVSPISTVQLEAGETLFVTTAKEFPEVVGEAFTARQRASKLAGRAVG